MWESLLYLKATKHVESLYGSHFYLLRVLNMLDLYARVLPTSPLKAIEHVESLCRSLYRLLRILNMLNRYVGILTIKVLTNVGSLGGTLITLKLYERPQTLNLKHGRGNSLIIHIKEQINEVKVPKSH